MEGQDSLGRIPSGQISGNRRKNRSDSRIGFQHNQLIIQSWKWTLPGEHFSKFLKKYKSITI